MLRATLGPLSAHCGHKAFCYARVTAGGRCMPIRLPKPLHGWRAFAGEVGVIVLGVLIALAAQQVAEEIHQRSEARSARESIQNELATYMSRAESRRVIRDCVARRLDEIQ